MAVGEIQISALPQAALPIDLSDIFHLKQGIEDKRCTLEQLLAPHSSLRNNPHGVTKTQIGLDNVINALQLVAANNLSDVTNVTEARANLQIMSSEEVNSLVQQHINDKSNPHNTTKAQVGLSNVQNWTTSNLYNEDADKYATARAVNNLYKAVQASYPVGTLHLSMNSANPATYLICGGTWELVSKGRALVGYSDNSRPVGSNFGSSGVSLSSNNLPSHSHSIYLTGGGHTHGATITIDSFDYGTKGTSSFDYGTKNTNTTGAHTHQFGGYINSFYGDSSHTSFQPGGGAWTQAAGDHSHSVGIGAHSHTVGIGAHTHKGTVTLQSSEHTHSGTTGATGAGQAFSIEQPSFVVYVWQRTA
ncbi:tail fiber protein [Salmonella phage vB_SalM_SPJ41]|uniref:Tail fiber protein n=1 Tax=Salmonella phage vB_SalM_SPJ41 TaxID=2961840 RepID=A0A9E7P790_9CAUD|nr:tail fiber protein [Salmonella phage vB_SalM_SPJ41]